MAWSKQQENKQQTKTNDSFLFHSVQSPIPLKNTFQKNGSYGSLPKPKHIVGLFNIIWNEKKKRKAFATLFVKPKKAAEPMTRQRARLIAQEKLKKLFVVTLIYLLS